MIDKPEDCLVKLGMGWSPNWHNNKRVKVQNDMYVQTQTTIPDFQLCYPW